MIADYASLAVKGLKEVYDNAAQKDIMQYKDSGLFDFRETNEYSEDFTSTESLSGFKELAEGETPPVLALDKGWTVNLKEKRFGGALQITSTMRRQSQSNKEKIKTYLDRQRDQLLVEGINKFLTDSFGLYNNAFDSSADTLAPDGVELCGTHSWKTTGSATFSNKGTEALDADAIDTMMTYAGAFQDAGGKPLPLDFDTIVVKKGSAAHREAKRLFLTEIKPQTVGNINIYQGGEFRVIATPYITNPLYWFGFDSKKVLPLYVGIGNTPSIGEAIPQNNGAIRYNSEGFWKVGITNLPFNFYGSNGTT